MILNSVPSQIDLQIGFSLSLVSSGVVGKLFEWLSVETGLDSFDVPVFG